MISCHRHLFFVNINPVHELTDDFGVQFLDVAVFPYLCEEAICPFGAVQIPCVSRYVTEGIQQDFLHKVIADRVPRAAIPDFAVGRTDEVVDGRLA